MNNSFGTVLNWPFEGSKIGLSYAAIYGATIGLVGANANLGQFSIPKIPTHPPFAPDDLRFGAGQGNANFVVVATYDLTLLLLVHCCPACLRKLGL